MQQLELYWMKNNKQTFFLVKVEWNVHKKNGNKNEFNVRTKVEDLQFDTRLFKKFEIKGNRFSEKKITAMSPQLDFAIYCYRDKDRIISVG